MAAKKTKKPSRKKQPSSGSVKRAMREKARRQKAIRSRTPGPREKIVSGCLAVGLALTILFFAFLTWTCIWTE